MDNFWYNRSFRFSIDIWTFNGIDIYFCCPPPPRPRQWSPCSWLGWVLVWRPTWGERGCGTWRGATWTTSPNSWATGSCSPWGTCSAAWPTTSRGISFRRAQRTVSCRWVHWLQYFKYGFLYYTRTDLCLRPTLIKGQNLFGSYSCIQFTAHWTQYIYNFSNTIHLL